MSHNFFGCVALV